MRVDGSQDVTPADVHVWCVDLDRPPWPSERLRCVLSADERRRADTLVFATDRQRFVHGRGLLRTILSWYAGADPAALDFGYGAQGKPELETAAGSPPLRFSCSRTAGLALYAITRDRRVGIDIEAVRPLPDVDDLARWCCADRECAALQRLPRHVREEAFLRTWTVKEAYAKAVGAGLALGVDRVEVAIPERGPCAGGRFPTLRALDGCADAAAAWRLREVSPDPDHVGSLVVEGHGWRLRRRRLLALSHRGRCTD
jgi:4'-phosphopantetheinyl transferase